MISYGKSEYTIILLYYTYTCIHACISIYVILYIIFLMSKRSLNLYIRTDILDLAIARGLDGKLSSMFEKMLESYLENDPDLQKKVSKTQLDEEETQILTRLNIIRTKKEEIKKELDKSRIVEIDL